MDRKRKNLSQSQVHYSKRTRRKQDDDDDDDDDDNDDIPHSQETNPGRAGRILRIYLRNFMCHSSLVIKFDPNTNYIIGRNGSGKSAILTALIVGLGGKARLTNRAANMKAFIKVGQTVAVIEITLSNTGPMAFNPRLYGSEITIVRSFTDTGTNSYKIKAFNGHIVTSAYREVNRLIDSLNIHVDNPVCILNQDVARTFLNTNDPSKKYIMFMKATNLESVKLQYKIAISNKKQAKTVLLSKMENLKKLEIEVKKLLKKYKAFENVEEVETKQKNLEVEAVWAQINVIESELREKKNIVDEIDKEITNFSDLIKNKDVRKKTLNENVEQIRQQLIEIRNEEEDNVRIINTKRNELQKLRETKIEQKNELTSIENVIKRKLTDRKTLENEINNSSEYRKNRIKIVEERDKKMLLAEKRQKEICDLIGTTENDLFQIRNALKIKQQEQNNLSAELLEVSSKVKQRQAKIRSMASDENNSLSVYGGTMHRILQSINNHQEQFKKVPKGPVGYYIKLKDKKWALAVEDFISAGMLMSFCVDNQNDAKILARIFNEICGKSHKPTIINSKFYDKIHNYSSNKVEAPNGCLSMIDAVIIKDPVIINCLIDQLSIENVLLISSNELARQLMSNAAYVPKNCSRAVTLNGDQYYPDPNYRSYACRIKNARYLQVSASEVIKIYQDELRSFTENEQTVRRQLDEVSKDMSRLIQELRKTEKKNLPLEACLSKIQREINDLKLQQVPPTLNIQILTEEMEQISRVIESKQVELDAITEKMETVKTKMMETENEYRELKNTSKISESRMTPLIERMTESETKLKQMNINGKFHQDKIKQCNIKLVTAKAELERKEKILKEKLDQAKPLGPRINTNRSLESILKELQEINQQLADIKASLGDKLSISQNYIRMQEKYNKTKNEVTKIKHSLDQMVDSVESRARHYQKLAEYIGVRVREMFVGVLKLRQFKGTIEIDHEKQTLDLVVIPQHGSSQGTGRTHILSGGERSYSTVAFLHALWQVMEYPFYFLDEFDVFMDKVNRRTVMDILLEHAKEHSDLQFVFLTPQDISGVIGDKNITVHRMADPERKEKH